MSARSRLSLFRTVVAGPDRPLWQHALFALAWLLLAVLILMGYGQEPGPLCDEPCPALDSAFPRPPQ